MRALLLWSVMALPALAQTDAVAEFRPIHLFGDHMVLPANARVPVLGFGQPGLEVEVVGAQVLPGPITWEPRVTTKIDADGHWRCELPTPARGGPFDVKLRSGGKEVTLHDVLVGDVWLASGQSNMEMTVGPRSGMRGVVDWEKQVAAADFGSLRVFTATPTASNAPAFDVAGVWQVCSPKTAAGFSASAFFFARELLQGGKAPIGLVVSSWGGTVCEAWASEAGLAAFPEFGDELAKLRTTGPVTSPDAQREQFWQAVAERRTAAVKSAEAGTTVQVPEVWSRTDLADFDGAVLYARSVDLPEAFCDAQLALELGAIDDMDTVLWNGVRIGGHEQDGHWQTPRRYSVPAGSPAHSELAVLVVDTGGEGGFMSDAKDLHLALAKDPSQSLPLAGAWSRRSLAAMADLPPWPRGWTDPNRPSVLWNGMLAPFGAFPFTGAIWYQGEANRGRAAQYAKLFPAMIRDWRRTFGRDLPFYFVQIAPFGYEDETGDKTALLREAQAAALTLPGTGMVVTLDCGNAADIHPADKQTVGKRLARLALAGHYGETVVSTGPRCLGVEAADEHALRVAFETGGGALTLDPGAAGFELAGEYGSFYPAVASIDGTALLLRAPQVEQPRHVRYAWAAVPGHSLRNAEGFPAAPFRASIR